MKKRTLCLFLCLVMLLSTAVFAANEKAKTIRLQKTEGEVSVTDASGNPVTLMEDMRLYHGYRVQTGGSSYVWLSLDDSKSVKLDENTRLELRKHGKKIELELISGSIFLDVTSHLGDDEELTVRTATIFTGVRGTKVILSTIPNPDTKLPEDSYELLSKADTGSESFDEPWLHEVIAKTGSPSPGFKDGELPATSSIVLLEGSLMVHPVSGQEFLMEAGQCTEVYSLDNQTNVVTRKLNTGDVGAFVVAEIENNPSLRKQIDDALGFSGEESFTKKLIQNGGVRQNPSGVGTYNGNSSAIKGTTDFVFGQKTVSSAHTHSWGAPVYKWDEDHNCYAIRICSTNSAHMEDEKAAAVCETVKATCEEDGSMTYTVVFQNAAFQTQTDRVVLTALGHDFDPKSDSDWIPYTEGGQVLYYYLKCEHEDCTEIESEIEYLNRIQNTETEITSYSGLMANQSEENTLTVSAGKMVNIENLSLAEGNSIDVYGTLNLTVSDAKQIIRNNGSIWVKDNGTLNISGTMESVNAITVSEYGTLNLLDQGTLNIQADRNSFSGTVNMMDGSSLNTSGAVVINGTLNIAEDASAAINGELKNGTAGTITLANNAMLTVSGIVSNEANLTLEAGSTLTIVGLMENNGTLTLNELAVLDIRKPETESDTTVLNNHGTILLADDSFLTVSHELWNAVDDSCIEITAKKAAPARIQSAAMTNNGSFTVASGAGLTLLSDEESPEFRNRGTLSVETGGELKAESYVLNNYGTVETAENSLLQISEIRNTFSTATENDVTEILSRGQVNISGTAEIERLANKTDITLPDGAAVTAEVVNNYGELELETGSVLTVSESLLNKSENEDYGISASIDVGGTLNLTEDATVNNQARIWTTDGSVTNLYGTMNSGDDFCMNYGTLNLYQNAVLEMDAEVAMLGGTVNLYDGSRIRVHDSTEEVPGTLLTAISGGSGGFMGSPGSLNVVSNAAASIEGNVEHFGYTVTLGENSALTIDGSLSSTSISEDGVGVRLSKNSSLTVIGTFTNQAGLVLDEGAALEVGDPEDESDPTVLINYGSITLSDSSSIIAHGQIFNVNSGTSLNVISAKAKPEPATIVCSVLTNSGTLTVESGALLSTDSAVSNSGTLTVESGAFLSTDAAVSSSGTMIFNGANVGSLIPETTASSKLIFNVTDSTDSESLVNLLSIFGESLGTVEVNVDGELSFPEETYLTIPANTTLNLAEDASLSVDNLENLGVITTASQSQLTVKNEIISYGQLIIGSDSSMTAEYLSVYAEREKETVEQESETQSAPAPKLVINGDAVVSHFFSDIEDASVGETGSLTLGGDSEEEPYSGIYGTLNVSGQLIVNHSLYIESMGDEPEVNGQVNILSGGTLTVHTISYESPDSVTIEPTASQNINPELPETGSITCYGKLHISGTLNYAKLEEQAQPT